MVRRRALLGQALRGAGALGGVLGATAAYARRVEPFRPVLERAEVPLPGLPAAFDGFMIAQLSDLHVQPGFAARRLRPSVEKVNALRPDLIVLTGDYINSQIGRGAEYLQGCVNECARLHARHGVFVVFGNHDFPPPPADPPRAAWEAAGIMPLLDEFVPVRREKEVVWLIGLRSFLMRPVEPGRTLSRTPQGATRILLWHEPDRALEAAEAGATLQLSGHTHGGQVVLPGLGPLILPSGGKKYPAGLFAVAGMMLYVTRGVGLLPPLVRLNCPPEVTLLTLRRAP